MTDLLATGVYTIPDASRLLGVNQSRVRRWICGAPNSQSSPLIENEVGRLDDKIAFSFINLIETRLVSVFARYGVHVRSIRMMMERAKEYIQHDHPFATDIMFRTDGQTIFIQVSEETGDPKLFDLRKKNFAFYRILEQSLKSGIVYGKDGLADSWKPKPQQSPHIIVHPHFAFGQPVLENSHVPTSALLNAFSVEDETYESVADWYDVPVAEVKEAIKFEMDLKQAA